MKLIKILTVILSILISGCVKDPPPPTITITANPQTIEYGGTTTITWTTTNSTSCSLNGTSTSGITGTYTTPPLIMNTTYTFTVVGDGGTITGTITITVGEPPKPILKVTVDNDTIKKGETVKLTIESTYVESLTIKGVTRGCVPEKTVPVTTEKTTTTLNGVYTTWSIVETTDFTVQGTGVGGVESKSFPVFVPSRTDTLCENYWIMTEWKYFYEGGYNYVKIDEGTKTDQMFFSKEGRMIIINKDGKVVGDGDWFWVGQDSIRMGGKKNYRYKLTESTFIRSQDNDSTIVTWTGYPL